MTYGVIILILGTHARFGATSKSLPREPVTTAATRMRVERPTKRQWHPIDGVCAEDQELDQHALQKLSAAMLDPRTRAIGRERGT